MVTFYLESQPKTQTLWRKTENRVRLEGLMTLGGFWRHLDGLFRLQRGPRMSQWTRPLKFGPSCFSPKKTSRVKRDLLSSPMSRNYYYTGSVLYPTYLHLAAAMIRCFLRGERDRRHMGFNILPLTTNT